MCLAIPARIVEIDPVSDSAIVSLDGVQKEISLVLVEDIGIGDYVLLHVGYALSKVSENEARRTLALFAEMDGEEPDEVH